VPPGVLRVNKRKTLYDEDFGLWIEQTIQQLQQHISVEQILNEDFYGV
jgi:hypothetical protein